MEPLDPPLRVDWLDADRLPDGHTGRLGMTFLPGKRGASTRYPGRVYRRELARDLGDLRAAGVHHLLLLVDDDELARWGDATIVDVAREHGVTVSRWPMPDGSPPGSTATMDAMLVEIQNARERGDVAVACMGGVGRTGTVVACVLVAAGLTVSGAIAEVRRARHPEAVETPEQERFVAAYAAHRAAVSAGSGRPGAAPV